MYFIWACSYDLSLEGKSCDTSHPCPSGYTCVAEPGHCTSNTDGGFECVSGITRCSVDKTEREVCEEGHWKSYDCMPDICENGQCVSQQPCGSSLDCPEGQWCGPDGICILKGSCENPGIQSCGPLLKSIVVCDSESGNMQKVKDCQSSEYCDPFVVLCMPYCDNDDDCAIVEISSCEPVSRKCLGMDVCTLENPCSAGEQCVGDPGACVYPPTEVGSLAGGGTMDLQCYIGDPATPPPLPATCDMQGAIVNFLNGESCHEQAVELTVKVLNLEDVLNGVLTSPIASTKSTSVQQASCQDKYNFLYDFTDLPTNMNLVIEVEGNSSVDGFEFASLYTFGLYIRSDDCSASGGTIDFAVPALYQVNYDGYANPLSVVSNPEKGLVFGQLRDCKGYRILNGKGGLSIPHELLYYLRGYIPDDTMESTGTTGFFIAANTTPIQGIASALVKSADGPDISLWEKPMRVFPGAASLVLFQKPKAPR